MAAAASSQHGPLAGVKVLEFSAIGPAPFAAMLLSRLGADVIRLHRPGETTVLGLPGADVDRRGRPALPVNLKDRGRRALALRLADAANAVIEGFRPGVMERLGLGPDDLLERNPRLVYGRITGYGQTGPLARTAGHDINYLAIAGVLGAMGRAGERPLAPLNLVADYGGGGMLLALGVVCGILEARASGRGQVVDAAMIDGVAQLASLFFSVAGAGAWGPPGTNVLDSGAHFYEVYETSDRRHMAVGAIEPQFYAELLRVLGMSADEAPQHDKDRWPELKARFASVFRTRTQAEWTEAFASVDACTTPVLSLDEAPDHPHNAARGTFADRGGVVLPANAPRFSRTPARGGDDAPDRATSLERWGLTPHAIRRFGL